MHYTLQVDELVGNALHELLTNGYRTRISFSNIDDYAKQVMLYLSKQGHEVDYRNNRDLTNNFLVANQGLYDIEKDDEKPYTRYFSLREGSLSYEVLNSFGNRISTDVYDALTDDKALEFVYKDAEQAQYFQLSLF